MALQIWTSRWTKISSQQKFYNLPYRLRCQTSKNLTMLKDYRLSIHHTISRPIDGNDYVPTSVIYNRIYKINSPHFSYETPSWFHSSACCHDHNKSVEDINKFSGSDVSSQTEHVTIAANLVSQTEFELGDDSDSEDMNIKPSLDSIKPSVPPPMHVDMVPGKGPPPEPPVDCCMSGCANCVWIQYAEELKQYFSSDSGLERVKKDIEKIDNPGLKMFLKLELGLL